MQAPGSESTPRTIVILATQLGGGIGRVLDHLAQALTLTGVRVRMLLSRDWGSFVESAKRHSSVHRLRTTHAWFGIPELIRHLQYSHPDAVITDTPRLTHLAIRSIRWVSPRPLVIAVVHNTYSVKFRELSKRKRSRRIRRMQKLYPQADRIVAVSAGVANDLSHYLGIERDRIEVIHNPVLPPGGIRTSPGLDPLAPYRQHGEFLIVGMGRLCAAKDFETLVQAFHILRERIRARLVIFGDGEDRPALLELIDRLRLHDFIHLPGHTSHAYEALEKADIFVLSSRWEGFGNVLAEALAVGTPVVSTDCPHGPAEILDGGRHGRLVPVGDACAMATAIIDTLSEKAEPDELKRAAERFSSEVAALRYMELLQRDHECPNGSVTRNGDTTADE